VAHLLGDAASPYVVGTLSDAFRKGVDTDEAKYFALQYALYSTCIVLIFGGIAYLITARYVIKDKELCKFMTQDTLPTVSEIDLNYGSTESNEELNNSDKRVLTK
jgi:hypothetical protein